MLTIGYLWEEYVKFCFVFVVFFLIFEGGATLVDILP